jgi:Rrf2 family protein
MANNPDQEYFSVKELARKLDVSQSYLGKVLQRLVQARYLRSLTGPNGGFALARDPSKISMLDLIHAVDGKKPLEHCVLGLAACSDMNPCPVHHTWKGCKASLLKEFSSTSIQSALKHSWPSYLKSVSAGKKSRKKK